MKIKNVVLVVFVVSFACFATAFAHTEAGFLDFWQSDAGFLD